MNVGLVLSGGGARGAYQVGALRALSELLGPQRQVPFSVLAGASVGAITSSFLAMSAYDFSLGVRRLVDFWSHIRPHEVFRTDASTLARSCARWVVDLGFRASMGGHREKSLLATEPLRQLLEERLDMVAVHDNIERGYLRSLAITATDYRTSLGVTFFDGPPEIAPWSRSTRFGRRARLTIDHVMASSAIPIFFPAIRVGDRYYADGCLRSVTPLSPAIHLGADRIVAIAVRCGRTQAHGLEPTIGVDDYPRIAETAGLLLNAVFVESLQADIERLERINRTLSLVPESAIDGGATPLRHIPLIVLRPSEDLGLLAKDAVATLPTLVQHLFRGLGVSENRGLDLMSYLAFDLAYTSKLLALGFADTMARADALLDFIAPREPNRPPPASRVGHF